MNMPRTRAAALPLPSRLALTLALATAGALSLAFLAQARIVLPGTPVPITLQVLGVLMLAGALGPWVGALAVGEYLLFGLCGLPVFTGAGLAATGGFLFAMPVAAVAYGIIYDRFAAGRYAHRIAGAVIAGLAGVCIIYLGGWAWMATGVLHLRTAKAFALGVAPFIGADIVKLAIVASALALRRKGTV